MQTRERKAQRRHARARAQAQRDMLDQAKLDDVVLVYRWGQGMTAAWPRDEVSGELVLCEREQHELLMLAM
jgi:hypothetical protein